MQYDDIALPSISSRHKISTVTDTYDSNANSAGQDNLGQILLSIMSFRRLRQQGKFTDGGLLLIDEVDAALHPIAQIRLIELLIQTARELKIQVVVSTHSLTILEKICPKAENDTNQNIQVVYFDNSNRLLNIKNNIPYNDIKNNLLIQVNNCKEFKIISSRGTQVFWKIDLYDINDEFYSPQPDDPTQTNRVMTILLADEY